MRTLVHAALVLMSIGVTTACSTPACPVGTREVQGQCQDPITVDASDESSSTSSVGTRSDSSSAAGSSAGTSSRPSPTSGSGGGGNAASSGRGGSGGASSGSPPSAAGSNTSNAGISSTETCSAEGATRCDSENGAAIEQCVGGTWNASGACAAGELCTVANGGAMCRTLEDACLGAGGSTICDPQGAMLRCNEDGTSEPMERCSSPALCQAGLAAGRCAICEPNEHRCTGTVLEVCPTDASGFVMQTDCMSIDLCDAVAGACTNAACSEGQYKCEGDVLKSCDPSLTGWTTVKSCPPGLCDAAGKACRICMPGQAMCQGDSVSTCDARGQAYTMSRCSGTMPFCGGQGRCVQCKSDADCGAGPCEKRSCNIGTGMCSAATPSPRGTTCTAPSPDQALPSQCTDNGVCAPVIALSVEARSAGDGTPIGQAYVSANPDGFIKAAGMNGGAPGPWEPFLMIRESPGSNRVALFSLANNGYVTPVAPGPVPAGKPFPERKWLGSQAGARAIFEFSSTRIGDSITIRSPSEGFYWSAEDWIDPPGDYVVRVRTPSSELGPWEHFTLLRHK